MSSHENDQQAGTPSLTDLRREHVERQAALAETVAQAVAQGLAAIEEVQRAVSAELRGAGGIDLALPVGPVPGVPAASVETPEADPVAVQRAFTEAEAGFTQAQNTFMEAASNGADGLPAAGAPPAAPWLPPQPADPIAASDGLMNEAMLAWRESLATLLASNDPAPDGPGGTG